MMEEMKGERKRRNPGSFVKMTLTGQVR